MKRNTIALSALALLAIACTKENLIENNGGTAGEVKLEPLELTAVIDEAESRTAIDNDGKVSWNKNDDISIFDAGAATNNKFITNDGKGSFTGQVPENATELYGLYPYRDAAKFIKTETETYIQSKLFPEQKAQKDGFATKVAVMAGKVDLETKQIEFKNMCSHICFKLTDDMAKNGVKSITLFGNNGEILCGSYQITFTENTPSLKVSDPEIYVKLSGDGDLEAGDYYFTIFPQIFEEGFEVIVSMKDGSQKAVRTHKKVTAVAKRNSILKMAVPTKYEDCLNYFVRYTDGFDITVGNPQNGGYVFNNTTHPGGTMKIDGKNNKSIDSDGVYFIDPHSANIKLSYNKLENLIICSTDSEKKAALNNTKSLQPATNQQGVLLMENILLTSTPTDVITQPSTDPGTAFGHIIFDNCIIKDLPRNLINLGNGATTINHISISNCDISTVASSKNVSYCISFASQESKLNNMNVYNNVFYYSGSAAMTDFKVLNAQKATVPYVNVTNNTFDRTIIPNAGMVLAGTLEDLNILKNVFNETVRSDGNSTLVSAKNAENAWPSTVQVIQNYYYTSGNYSLNIPKEIRPADPNEEPNGITGKAGTPVKLSQSPLSESWNPAEGAYGQYNIVPADGKPGPTEQMGATRADMNEVVSQ